ncbi:MAG: FIST C-terminal domain-containing protein [Ktedonobacteraceae bacterium]|nr:FIST C-terminal domain-containing protein [Ktedonobacteraceae bacterium]
MKIEQLRWQGKGWEPVARASGQMRKAQLLLLFGSPSLLKKRLPFMDLRERYPGVHLLGCSTAGEIADASVLDDSLVATAIQFEHTALQAVRIKLKEYTSSFEAGELLARRLVKERLAHVFVLSHGKDINGSALVAGLKKHLPPHVAITGGLAGDGTDFRETFLLWEGALENSSIGILGFYGERLCIGYGSFGGWDAFGPYRLITRSSGNVLYELDGKPALLLYKAYLGEQARDLPASGLLFPLCLLSSEDAEPVVRTLLSVNEAEQSITFAGDVPEGNYARFMRTNFEHLVEGASTAARTSYEAGGAFSPDLAVLVSCVGRKLVLQKRTVEEVKEVRRVLGGKTILTGFYSYGEISPFRPGAMCRLHNQTMTVTTFSER